MRPRSIPALAVLMMLTSVRAHTQSNEPVFHADSNFQPLAVQVIDKQGKYVQGLAAEDFTIFEDDQRRRIVLFGGPEQPVSLSVLIDSSQVRARELLRPLLRARSAEEVTVLLPIGPAVYDSVSAAICKMRSSRNLRQAIVLVVGENEEMPNRLRLDELTRAAQDASAQIFPVLQFEPHAGKEALEADFERMATQSGGEVFFASSEPDLKRALDRIILVLRSQYTLAYYPENVERFRRIQVKTSREGAFAVLLGSRPVGYLYDGTGVPNCGAARLN
jgi:hypothetical protein